jgi:hypothetical protein
MKQGETIGGDGMRWTNDNNNFVKSTLRADLRMPTQIGLAALRTRARVAVKGDSTVSSDDDDRGDSYSTPVC